MDWKKAKRLIIIFLVLLNAGLFALNYMKSNNYRLSKEHEKAIYRVLEQNGIGMYTDIIDEYKPMRQLNVNVPVMDTEILKNTFFEDQSKIKVTFEFNKTILRDELRTLTIENNFLNFECKTGTGKIDRLSEDSATKTVAEFLKPLGRKFASLKLDKAVEMNDGFMLEYFDSYKGVKVFGSRCSVFIDASGIKTLTVSYYDADGFTGDRKEICSPDEALLTFVYEMKKEKNDNGVYISKMELGYDFQESVDIADGRKIRLVPCYYIYRIDKKEPYVIYAYTNQMKETQLQMQ